MVQGEVLCTAWLNEPVGEDFPNPCRCESLPQVTFCATALQLHSRNELLDLNLRLPSMPRPMPRNYLVSHVVAQLVKRLLLVDSIEPTSNGEFSSRLRVFKCRINQDLASSARERKASLRLGYEILDVISLCAFWSCSRFPCFTCHHLASFRFCAARRCILFPARETIQRHP
jgi:hypothetical protein